MDGVVASALVAVLPMHGPPLLPQSTLVSAYRAMRQALAFGMFGRLNEERPE